MSYSSGQVAEYDTNIVHRCMWQAGALVTHKDMKWTCTYGFCTAGWDGVSSHAGSQAVFHIRHGVAVHDV